MNTKQQMALLEQVAERIAMLHRQPQPGQDPAIIEAYNKGIDRAVTTVNMLRGVIAAGMMDRRIAGQRARRERERSDRVSDQG